jgi:AcrR family transcriptional regulator
VTRADARSGAVRSEAPADEAPGVANEEEQDERSRLLEVTVQTVAERGYMQTKVSELTARAEVTRAQFYELFPGKQDCFLAAQHELGAAVSNQMRQTIAAVDASEAGLAALAVLVDLDRRAGRLAGARDADRSPR